MILEGDFLVTAIVITGKRIYGELNINWADVHVYIQFIPWHLIP